ncbi:ABC transporter permease [Streptomyces pristinaespiralis]|uniref:ABC transporter permease n=1 Tax=Streptomyces pristinaespiralis TaxID=38300 RepID=UPI0037954E4F
MSTYELTPTRVLRSEWHKLWTLRSTWITLMSAGLLTFSIGLLMGATYETGGGDGDVDVVVLTLIGVQFAQIAFAVLGILVTAGEYSTGMIRASMTTVPRRLPVLWSKAAVFGAVTLAVTLVTAFVTFPVAQLFFAGTDQEASLGDPGVARALVGSSAGLTLLGLIALGLGALVRSVPGAIGAFIGGLMVLPEVITMLPYEFVADALRYFPTKALETLMSAEAVPGAASPGGALTALALWAAATLAAAGVVLKRRDV